MKVLAINGSPKVNGNTAIGLKVMEEVFKAQDIEMEIVTIGNELIKGCNGCGMCFRAESGKCEFVKDDIVNICIDKMANSDAIILASPVYFSGMNGTMKSFLDRFFYVGSQKNLFRHKVSASITAVRRTGGSETFFDLLKYLTYSQTYIASSSYWNVIHGAKPGEVTQDEEGIRTLEILAENMAYLMKVMNETKVVKPDLRKRVMTNFIR